MKKLSVLIILFFLTACSGMTGPTVTNCVGVEESLVQSGVGQTVIEIQGYNEDIITWTVSTTLTRAEFDVEFLNGIYLSDEEIHDLFANYNPHTIPGVFVYVSELNADYLTITRVYNYGGMNNEDLSRLWGVDDFSDSVTLSTAIESLEERGATCIIFEVEPDED